MSVVDGARPIFDRYFEVWQARDPARVGELFHENATYERKGKVPFRGVGEIEGYWKRNRGRQIDLTVFQHVLLDGRADACTFCARFVDIEEKQTQTVFGWMTLEVADGKILRLREGYHVHREPLAAQDSRTVRDWLANIFRWVRWKSVEWSTRLVEMLAVQASRIVY